MPGVGRFEGGKPGGWFGFTGCCSDWLFMLRVWLPATPLVKLSCVKAKLLLRSGGAPLTPGPLLDAPGGL